MDSARKTTCLGRVASFVLNDHRYVLLGTSVVALIGMLLSSSPRSQMSFLAHYYTLELVMYYLLVLWLVISFAGLVVKLLHWNNYAEVSPFARTGVRHALRIGSYVVWAITLVLFIDRVVMGFVAAWVEATTATSRPDNALASTLYMVWQGRDIFARGAMTTVGLALFGTIIAFVLAILLVFCRVQQIDRPDNDLTRFLKVVGGGFARFYSTIVRGTPMMVQGCIIYYGVFNLLRATSLSVTQINGIWTTFMAGLVTISLNSCAYMMEVLRGGIESVDPGQAEAACSLGLSQWQAMSKVVFPQGIKNAIPGLSNELVVNIKDSSVLSVIGTFDLMFASRTVAGIYYQNFQANLVAAVVYLMLTLIASHLLGILARRLDVRPQPLMSTSDMPMPTAASQTAEEGRA